jgi:CBS domain-containing protein
MSGVAKLLSGRQISLVVVCNSDGAMAGVITKSNIVQQIGDCRGSACTGAAADVMTRNVAYCSPNGFLPDVLSMMEKRDFVHIPVVDDNFTPIGVVNARDALRELMAEGEYEESLLRDYVMGIGYRSGFAADESRGPHRATVMEGDS